MAEVKSHEFDAFAKRKPLPVRLFLIYGPDRGLVSERAATLAAASGVNLDDAFSVVKLDASDIGNQPGRLIDEMNAIGLFGGERLVWIRNAGSEKGLSDGLDILAGQHPGPSTLIIEAGDLKKGAALRKVAESASQAVAIACAAGARFSSISARISSRSWNWRRHPCRTRKTGVLEDTIFWIAWRKPSRSPLRMASMASSVEIALASPTISSTSSSSISSLPRQ